MVSNKVVLWSTVIASIALSGLFYVFSRIRCVHPHCVETYANDSITILYSLYLIFIFIAALLCKLISQLPYRIRYWLEKDIPVSPCRHPFIRYFWFEGSVLEFLTFLAILALVTVNFVLYWNLMLSVSAHPLTEKAYWSAALMGSGHMADVLLGLILIPLGRHSFLPNLLGIHIDAALRFHKRCGILLCLISLAHGFVIWTKTVTFLDPPSYFYWTFNIGVQGPKWIFYVSKAGFMTTFGFISGATIAVLWLFTFPIVRRRLYHFFYVVHIIFGPLMIISAGFHTSSVWYYSMPGAFLLLVDWIIRLYNYSKKKKALIRREECGYIRIDIFEKINVNVGSFVMIKIDELGWQISHPFTVADDNESLVLLIKPTLFRSEWTNQLADLLPNGCLEKEITVRIDGSFGYLKFDVSKTNLVACFVGGVGIAGALAVASHVLEYNVGSYLVFIFWAAREINAGKLSLLQKLINRQDSRLRVHLFGKAAGFSNDLEGEPSAVCDLQTSGVKGSLERMNPNELLQQVVLPCATRSAKVGVYTCGPQELMDSVQKACENGHKSVEIYFHRESFQW
ncbi:unnamed protein product [Adineta ricciae]|uniref:FAD-binding FR-type domain-containing protein n=2 Tax=Adineta ricciae TaxID=249248 RepID=A0A815K2J6_ADIRI|nr:unnamed protein product [Adineta ricciae]